MLGVCYYPEHWPEAWWADDARRMAEMGIRFVRIGEFAWSRIEPEAGRFEWGWLDRAIEMLGAAGLKVVLGTPTATPPKWLCDAHPEIYPVDAEGRVRGFGSRRHYSFSSPVWIAESARIVEAVALRYGGNPHVAGFQTDNEYGCHGTTLSYGEADLRAFRAWLRRRYQDPERLNEAWGNVFWSMEVGSFDEVALPMATTPAETNPAARLDFWRFASSQIAAYNRMQCEILRRHAPGKFVTHNFMGLFTDFDHYEVAADLDFASWDSYPLGFLETSPLSEAEKERWAETSHPDVAPFSNDLYRAVGRGRFWIMEQQPGPVNWAPFNPAPKPGMVRLWAWEAFAHGAEVVSYFRWRQAAFAQEQMHAGLNRPDRQLSPGGTEAAKVGRERAAIELPATRPGQVAIVFDYEANAILEIQPQAESFRYAELAFRFYEAVRRLGLDVDFLAPGESLAGYALTLVPSMPHVSDAAFTAFEKAEGLVLYGPRTGSKTRHFHIPETLPPGPLQALLPIRVVEVSGLRPGRSVPISGAIGDRALAGRAERWIEHVESANGIEALATFTETGRPALLGRDRQLYLAAWPSADFLASLVETLVRDAGLPITPLPEGVRLRRRGDLAFAFNYGDEPYRIDGIADDRFLIGGPVVPPQDLACWRP